MRSKLFGLGRFNRSRSSGRRFPALLLLFAGFLDESLARKADFVAFDGEHFDHDLIAQLQLVANIADAMFGNFTDVEQTIGTGEKLDESAEFRESNNFAEIGFAHFGTGGNVADHLKS